MYFQLAHWSKYILPGSVMYNVEYEGAQHEKSDPKMVAFQRPDGKVVLVVLADQLDGWGDPPPNRQLTVHFGEKSINLSVIAGSISTVLLDGF